MSDERIKSILSDTTLEFSSSEEGIRCITKEPIDSNKAFFIELCLRTELKQIGYSITYVFGIFRKDGTANINFTVRKEGVQR